MTPKVVKVFLIIILGLSLLSGLSGPLVPKWIHPQEFLYYFGLSAPGVLHHHFIWQLLSHALFYPAFRGFDSSYFIHIVISLYLLWRFGSLIAFQRGGRHFVALLLGGAFISGLTALAILFYKGSGMLFLGFDSAITALMTAMIMLYPDAELLFFFIIPLKGRMILLISLAFTFLSELSQGLFLNFFAQIATIAFAYLYCVIAWRVRGPFPQLAPLENFLLKKPVYQGQYAKNAKIYDFKTGHAILKDDAFVDACLEKISKEGKGSLTLLERLRLFRVARRRRKNRTAR